jgi:hypothetical protein
MYFDKKELNVLRIKVAKIQKELKLSEELETKSYKVTVKICRVCKKLFLCNIKSKESLNGNNNAICGYVYFKRCECSTCYAKRLLGRYKLNFFQVNKKFYSPRFTFDPDEYSNKPVMCSCWLITKKDIDEWALNVL